MLEVTFKGSNIVKQGNNNNLAQLDDPKIDAAMDKASTLQGDARSKAWAEIDKMITADAPAVPFDWDKTTLIWSKDVNGVGNQYYSANGLDYSYTSLK
jgi:ABC-type transport system substrate-binding protein